MDLLTLIIIIIILAWIFGAFIFPVGGALIHALLVLAIIIILFKVIRR